MYSLSGNKQDDLFNYYNDDDDRLHDFFKNLMLCLIKYIFFSYRNFRKFNDLTKADVAFLTRKIC